MYRKGLCGSTGCNTSLLIAGMVAGWADFAESWIVVELWADWVSEWVSADRRGGCHGAGDEQRNQPHWKAREPWSSPHRHVIQSTPTRDPVHTGTWSSPHRHVGRTEMPRSAISETHVQTYINILFTTVQGLISSLMNKLTSDQHRLH